MIDVLLPLLLSSIMGDLMFNPNHYRIDSLLAVPSTL